MDLPSTNFLQVNIQIAQLHSNLLPTIVRTPVPLGVPIMETLWGPDSAGKVTVAGMGSKFNPSVRTPCSEKSKYIKNINLCEKCLTETIQNINKYVPNVKYLLAKQTKNIILSRYIYDRLNDDHSNKNNDKISVELDDTIDN